MDPATAMALGGMAGGAAQIYTGSGQDEWEDFLRLLQSGGTPGDLYQQYRVVGPSAMEGLAADPRSLALQREAAAQLISEGSKSGMGLLGRSRMQDAADQAGQITRSNLEGVANQYLNRGQNYGTPAAMAAALSGQSQANETVAQTGRGAVGEAIGRSTQQLGAGGQMAGQTGQWLSDLDAARRNARDTLRYFNSMAAGRAQQDWTQRMGVAAAGQEGRAKAKRAQGWLYPDFGAGAGLTMNKLGGA